MSASITFTFSKFVSLTKVGYIRFLLMVCVIHSLFGLTVGNVDYCKKDLECEVNGVRYKNSACNCSSEVDLKSCGIKPVVTKFSEYSAFESRVVEKHNYYRNQVASGKDKNIGGNVGATDMMALQYDKGLEYTAYCYSFKCNDNHDKCRITEKFTSAGQNQYALTCSGPCSCDASQIDAAIKAWYDEIEHVKNRKCVTDFDCELGLVGHWSQVVWAKTTHVGCAIMSYKPSDKPTCNIFCNYGPAGNWDKERVYTLGKPGRDCKKRDSKFTSLCVGPAPESGAHDGSTSINSSGLLLISTVAFVLIFSVLLW